MKNGEITPVLLKNSRSQPSINSFTTLELCALKWKFWLLNNDQQFKSVRKKNKNIYSERIFSPLSENYVNSPKCSPFKI